jgi:hypothetical protein
MTDAAVVVKPGHVKARANTEGPGHEKGQVDNQLTVDASTSVMVRDVEDPSSKVAFVCETRATTLQWYCAIPETSIMALCVAY